MMPGMNSRQAQQMMRKMGMNQTEMDVSEIIMVLKDRKLVFRNPNVSKITMMGQETYQVVGSPREESLEDEEEAELVISDDDIQTVVDQTGVSKELAKLTIEITQGDLAEAILKLKK
jgi:nascent polypeptide-associated complex subunit alpha